MAVSEYLITASLCIQALLCYVTLCYVTLRYVMLRYVKLCYVMLCYVTLRYVTLCCVMLCYVMLRYVTLRYVTLRYVTLCYVMLCYVMLCCVVLCCVMLCYVIGYVMSWCCMLCSVRAAPTKKTIRSCVAHLLIYIQTGATSRSHSPCTALSSLHGMFCEQPLPICRDLPASDMAIPCHTNVEKVLARMRRSVALHPSGSRTCDHSSSL